MKRHIFALIVVVAMSLLSGCVFKIPVPASRPITDSEFVKHTVMTIKEVRWQCSRAVARKGEERLRYIVLSQGTDDKPVCPKVELETGEEVRQTDMTYMVYLIDDEGQYWPFIIANYTQRYHHLKWWSYLGTVGKKAVVYYYPDLNQVQEVIALN